MEIIYKISIGAIILLGIAHVGFTFVKYRKLEPQALWFMSAGMGLLFCGLINYLNLSISSRLTHSVALGANLLLVVFTTLLLAYIRSAQIIALAVVSLLLVLSNLFVGL